MADHRREMLESVLKRRIFLADRQEKLENILAEFGLVQKDIIYCSDEELKAFSEKLEELGLDKVYERVLNEKEEVWFDIYRSICSQVERVAEKRKSIE